MKLSNRLDVFSEYVFSMLGKKVKEQEKKTGKKVLDLSIGTPNFPPSKEYVQKLQEFYTEPKASLYPGFGAIPEFSEALKSWYKKRFNVTILDNELLPLLGAKEAVAHLPPALINEGDDILIPDPGYPAYVGSALMAKAIPVFYSLDNNFKLSINEIDKKITSKTKCVWVNFPSNPTGQVAAKDELQKLIDFLKGKNIWLIFDNAYSEIAFDGFVAPSILEIDGAKEFTVELNSFSKMFSFAGYRIGWAAGNKDAISGLAKIKSQIDSGLSYPLQKVGAYALTHFDQEWHDNMIKSYLDCRDKLVVFSKKLGLIPNDPKGALYIWAKIPNSYKDSLEYCFELLEKKHIVVAPGTAFGNNGKRFVRISFCSNIENINNY